MQAVECCGNERTTKFCPHCGRNLQATRTIECLMDCDELAERIITYLGDDLEFVSSPGVSQRRAVSDMIRSYATG